MTSSIIESGLIFLAGLIIGFVLGYSFRHIIKNEKFGGSERTLISMVVLLVWVISVLYDIGSADYQTPFAIHGIFGAIVGFFYDKNPADFIKNLRK